MKTLLVVVTTMISLGFAQSESAYADDLASVQCQGIERMIMNGQWFENFHSTHNIKYTDENMDEEKHFSGQSRFRPFTYSGKISMNEYGDVHFCATITNTETNKIIEKSVSGEDKFEIKMINDAENRGMKVECYARLKN